MNKVHPHVTLMLRCKHAAALLLLFNYHLLLLQDSQNDCTCPFYPVQIKTFFFFALMCLGRRNGSVEVAEGTW